MGLMGRGMPGRHDRGTMRNQDALEKVLIKGLIHLVEIRDRSNSDDESIKETGDERFDKQLR